MVEDAESTGNFRDNNSSSGNPGPEPEPDCQAAPETPELQEPGPQDHGQGSLMLQPLFISPGLLGDPPCVLSQVVHREPSRPTRGMRPVPTVPSTAAPPLRAPPTVYAATATTGLTWTP